MLFIERGIDEAVCVGETIVRVLEVLPGEVRLAISSPSKPRYREVVLQCRSADEEQLSSVDCCDESLSFFA